jgi:hypothetical protein
VHVGDCSEGGTTVIVTDELFAIRGEGGLRAIGRIKDVTMPEAGLQDVRYLPAGVSADGAPILLSQTIVMRFKMSGPDRAEVEGLLGPDGVKPFPADYRRALTMRRCPSIWKRMFGL